MSFENPASILFDLKGTPLAVSHSQALESDLTGSNSQPGLLFATSGSDGIVRFVKGATDGAVFITGSVSVTSNTDDVDQGDHGTPDQSWYMVITDGTSSIAYGTSASNPLFVESVHEDAPNSTVSGTNASATSLTLLTANPARTTALFYYAGTKNLYLKFGVSASLTSFTVKMSALSYYEVPGSYTGRIDGIWDNTSGTDNFVQTTEITN